MGIFGFIKKEKSPAATPIILGAAAKGTFVPMKDIPDEVFSSGVLGPCCGIDPTEGNIFSPADGKISHLADTLHAIGLETDGIEILIHAGVDTVDMNGDGFSNKVKPEQTVKKGELLLSMDLDKIHAANHAATVIMAVTNSDNFSAIEPIAADTVQPGDDILKIIK